MNNRDVIDTLSKSYVELIQSSSQGFFAGQKLSLQCGSHSQVPKLALKDASELSNINPKLTFWNLDKGILSNPLSKQKIFDYPVAFELNEPSSIYYEDLNTRTYINYDPDAKKIFLDTKYLPEKKDGAESEKEKEEDEESGDNEEPKIWTIRQTSDGYTVTHTNGMRLISEQVRSCEKCLSEIHELLPEKDPTKMCASVCDCEISNIELSQLVSIDFTSDMSQTTFDQFKQNFDYNLFSKAYQKDSKFFNVTPEKNENITKSLQKIHQEMYTSSFQSSVQKVVATQSLTVYANHVYGVKMNNVVNAVSSVIQSNSVLNKAVSKLSIQIIQISTQITESAIVGIVELIVKIVVLLVFFILLSYILNLFFMMITNVAAI